MNFYHYILIVVLIAGSFTPLLNKRLPLYERRKNVISNFIVIAFLIFIIIKSSK